MMTHVTTGSRLHFGLIGLGADAPRRFGGVGLMVERPGLSLRVEPSERWSASGPLAERALAFAQQFSGGVGMDRPQRLVVEQAPPEHVGLGTGTQLGMAVARVLANAWGLDLPAEALARQVGRGRRSGLGVHGFARGGFLVDGGKGESDDVAPLLVRAEFPQAWRVVLARPLVAPGLHGVAEQSAFADLGTTASPARTDALCQLVLLGMLPALAENDYGAFGEAVYEFNRVVGEGFAAAQGGVYAGPAVSGLVNWFRGQGVKGAGQSSWGPTVFAIVADEDRAQALAEKLRSERIEVAVTAARNRGAEYDCSV